MTPKRALVYVELDIEVCGLTYGVSPCQAVLGVTGDDKCFNTRKTCQDLANIDLDIFTLRFAKPTNYLPKDFECIPCLSSYSFTPGTVSLGENLGTRSTLQVTLRDHPHSDVGTGFDPYVTERDYNPFEQGSIFGKLRCRQPYLRGKSIRLLLGFVGDDLDEMETRNFVVESFDGPNPQGDYTLIAKDILKLVSGDRAQAPLLSGGFLTAGISSAVTTLSLSPSGIGSTDYPNDSPTGGFYVAIGGKEVVRVNTRTGDSMGIARAQLNTVAIAHNQEDRVQLVLAYEAMDVALILYDLLVNYAGVDPDFIPLSSWLSETGSFINNVYTAYITEPTAVEKLVSELIEQAGLAIWWDDLSQLIQLQVIRGISTDVDTFTEANVLRGSLRSQEQPDKRLSQVWTYYGLVNPLEPIDDPNNYRSIAASINLDAETAYGLPSIKKVFSRWVAAFGRSVALRVGDNLIARFTDPPRKFNFDVFRSEGQTLPALGGGYQLSAWPLQDAFGAEASVPIQVTRINPFEERMGVEAEEMLFTQFSTAGGDVGDHIIFIDTNSFNINLRTVHDAIYGTPEGGSPSTRIICYVQPGVIVGSVTAGTTEAAAAFNIGSWPVGTEVQLRVLGRLQGKGGASGNGGNGGKGSSANSSSAETGDDGSSGGAGGTALYSRFPFTLYSSAGEIWGGGGGGAGGGGGGGGGRFTHSVGSNDGGGGGGGGGSGGGGAGTQVGAGAGGAGAGAGGSGGHAGQEGDDGGNGSAGTATAGGGNGDGGDGGQGGHGGHGGRGGTGGDGGSGGGPGLAGGSASSGDSGVSKDSPGRAGGGSGSAGAAGRAIDGVSFRTLGDTPADIRGSQVN